MTTFIQCKYCYDQNIACKQCNGSGYQEIRTFREKWNDFIQCIFPCLKDDFKYKKVETTKYDGLFDIMNDMESTSLIDDNNELTYPEDIEKSKLTPESSVLFNDPLNLDYSENIAYSKSSESYQKTEEYSNKVQKITIPNNGYSVSRKYSIFE